MIQTRVEKMSNGVIKQDLSVEGDTYSALVELVALSIGVLSAVKIQQRGQDEECTLDERIDLFCKLLRNRG